MMGISSRSLSELIDHSSSYVGMIESKAAQDQYSPHEYPKLAKALNCTIHDLLPPDKSESTGELIDKKVISLSNESELFLKLRKDKELSFTPADLQKSLAVLMNKKRNEPLMLECKNHNARYGYTKNLLSP